MDHRDLASVDDWLGWRSAISPNRIALKCGSVRWTYEELNVRVGNLAELFLSWGIRKGDGVAILLHASELYVASVLALMRIGAVTVPLNVRLSPSELLLQLKDSRPSMVLYDEEPPLSCLKRRISESPIAGGNERYRWRSSAELETGHSDRRGPRRREFLVDEKRSMVTSSSLHSIIYTSGSAGMPKGVEITTSNLLWNAISVGLRTALSPEDRWLLVLPLYHVGGYTILFRSILHGSSIVLHPRFEASEVREALDNEGITLVSLVPTMLHQLFEAKGRRPFPSSLRLIFLGGSQPSPSLTRAIRKKNLPVFITYGMTETCSQVAVSDLSSENGISYRPMFPTSFAIKKSGREKKSASKREVPGEILAKGPTIFRGYWRNRTMTKGAFEEGGWFRTGDVGLLDNNGEIIVLGRKEDMIKSGGEKIYPVEVESALLEHEAVDDAIVVGRDDRVWGQRVEAVVKVAQGSTPPSPAELTKFLRERIGSYKIPKKYHFWPSIPKTSTGKTERQAVRESLEREDVPEAVS